MKEKRNRLQVKIQKNHGKKLKAQLSHGKNEFYYSFLNLLVFLCALSVFAVKRAVYLFSNLFSNSSLLMVIKVNRPLGAVYGF
jgi:type IV secretory pathway VirB4 component